MRTLGQGEHPSVIVLYFPLIALPCSLVSLAPHALMPEGSPAAERKAAALQFRLLSLHKQLFCEPSPAPTKWTLAQLGRCRPDVRLPLVELTASGQATVGAALRDAGLL